MAKFTKGFPEELMIASINCVGGVYSKGIFSYTWHYKTPRYIFQFNDVSKNGENITYINKIIERAPWYLPNTLIYNNGWIFGYRSHEYRVQKDFDEMIQYFKNHKKNLKKLGLIENMSYKKANEIINGKSNFENPE